MLPVIEKLLVIQDRDQRIRDLRKELERLPLEEEMARQKLEGDENAVAEVKREIQENEVAIKNLELDIETRKDSIAKLKVQQFETKKNNEFQTMGQEIERYGEEVTALEDTELEHMEVGETLAERQAQAEAALATTQELVDSELAQIVARRAQSETTIAELETDRAELAADIDEDLLSQFDRLFANKGDAAVVPLNNGICGGCHVKVIANTLSIAKSEKEIAQCEQCGRLLYFDG